MLLLPFLSYSQFFFLIGILGSLSYQAYLIFTRFIRSKLQRKLPKRSAAPSNTKSPAFIRDIRAKHESLPKESAEWLNIFLNKFYADFIYSTAFENYFYTQYVRALFSLRRTVAGYVIRRAELDSWYTGDVMPRIRNVSVPYQSSDHSSVTLLMDLDYEPNIQGIGSIDTILGVNFLLRGDLKSLYGTLMFEYNPDTYSYSFIRAPKVDLKIRALVNGWELPLFNQLLTWIWYRIWMGKNVLPKTRTMWHRNKPVMPPYPWEVTHDPELLYKWPKPANAKYDPEDTDCE